MRNTRYFVARQNEGVDVLRARGYTGPVEVVGNAVDDAIFRPMDRTACRKALGVGGFVAGYVGRLVEEKGLMDIVDAVGRCPSDVSFIFVGSGPFQAALESRVADLALSGRVRFIPPRPMHELPSILNAIDVLLLVSRTTATWKEQFGRVIIEAHSCGTPVIGSDSGAIPEVIDQGGIVVEERHPVAIASALQRLAEEPSLGREMGAKGRSQVQSRYTWKQVAERMGNIYAKMGAC